MCDILEVKQKMSTPFTPRDIKGEKIIKVVRNLIASWVQLSQMEMYLPAASTVIHSSAVQLQSAQQKALCTSRAGTG